MRAAELLWPNGKIDTSSVRDALATDHYIVGSDSLETYHPRFTYHGFRYVCVRGLPERPDTNTLRACVVHNDLNSTGRPLITQIMCPSRKTHLILKESI